MTEGRPVDDGPPLWFPTESVTLSGLGAQAGSLTPPVERVFWESQRPLAFIR